MEANCAVLLIALEQAEPAGALGDWGLDRGGETLQQIAPAITANWIALCRLWRADRRAKEVRMRLNQFDPPITNNTCHAATPRFPMSRTGRLRRSRPRGGTGGGRGDATPRPPPPPRPPLSPP